MQARLLEAFVSASAPPPDHHRADLRADLRDPGLESIPLSVPPGGVLRSFSAAFAGVARTIATQRNMKVHMLAGMMVTIVGMALPLDIATRAALLFAVAIVFFAEILNTALEAFVDLFIRDFHRLALLAKDAAAAGVLVLAVVTVLIFCDVLWTRWDLVTANLDAVARSVAFGVPVVVLEAIGLFWVRRGVLSFVRFVISFGLVALLASESKDPIYAAVALMFVCLDAYARYAFPRTGGRGAPRKNSGAGVRVPAP